MGKSGTLLIINLLFAAIKTTEPGESKFAFPQTVTPEDVNSLLSITSKEALPLILFETKTKTKLQNAVAMTVAEITDGKLTSGTKFYTRHSSDQIFFCPNKDKPKNCLDPKRFTELQTLKCELEPTPVFQPNPNGVPCGPASTGLDLIFGYEICPAQEPYKYKMKNLVVFSICYEQSSKRILFTDHMITSSGLLSEKLLIREREIEFGDDERSEIFEHIPLDYFTEVFEKSDSKPQYKLQRLVPTDDMALATARKLTQNYANYALQHQDLYELWNQIRAYIRAHAIKWFDEPLVMMTGVFDIPEDELSTPIEEDELASVWVLLIIDLTVNSSKGMAIFMNNFITEETQYIDKICGKDLCVDNLKKKAEEVSGQVRCCQVTENISKLFMAKEDILPINELLKIQNITSSDDALSKLLNLIKWK